MMHPEIARLFPLMIGVLIVSVAAGCQSAPKGAPALDQYKGEVLLLLMGSPTCPGTVAATRVLTDYNRDKPEGVAVMRIDVPPPGGAIKNPAKLAEGFPYEIDHSRLIADQMGFFFYPTLYILDRDGEVRFSGGCEAKEVANIAARLLAENPGDPKTMFSPTMPSVGDEAVRFTGKTLGGEPVGLDDLRGKEATLLFFGTTTCPYSKKAVETLPGLMSEFKPKGTSLVIVNKGGSANSIRDFYTEKTPDVPVVVDGDGRISEKDYGVQVVPFFYVLDGNGLVAFRMPFSEDAARQALSAALGLTKVPVKIKAAGAG